MQKLSGKDKAIAAARAMDEKKADDIQILKMVDMMAETDYFVICSCDSFPQMQSVSQAVLDAMELLEVPIKQQEGRNNNHWMLLDYGDFVAHIFHTDQRDYYKLEKLWADAERITF